MESVHLLTSCKMKLPNGVHAVVEISKLRDYCLDPQHPRGRHKTRVFAVTFGLTQADAPFLRDELLRAAREVDAVPAEADQYGERLTVDFELSRNNRLKRYVALGSCCEMRAPRGSQAIL